MGHRPQRADHGAYEGWQQKLRLPRKKQLWCTGGYDPFYHRDGRGQGDQDGKAEVRLDFGLEGRGFLSGEAGQ